MQSSNDFEFDQDRVARKLQDIAARRRAAPLSAVPQTAVVFTAGDEKEMTDRPQQQIQPAAETPRTGWKSRIRSMPVLGNLLAWIYAIVRLNRIRREIDEAHQRIDGRLDRLSIDLRYELQGEANRMRHEAEQRYGTSLGRLEQLDVGSRLNRLDALDISNRLIALDNINIANRLNQIEATLRAMQERDRERDNRIAALIQELRQRTQPAASPEPAADAEHTAVAGKVELDSFYVEFEGMFRGSREDIQNRQRAYLSHVAHLAGDDNALVVDIGCGRGEWIELLGQERIKAIGIDMNGAMVELCRERGLAAQCIDAIAYLNAQPAGSVAAVTGFHIIEHLPFEQLIALFDAALRALRPDGLIIFETPNPENMVVGSCNFYYDPTHRHPIAPVIAEFIARQRGFARAEIQRLNAFPDAALIAEDSEVARRVNRAFYGPQDYAVLAWKTHAN